jgi:zinc/manganese transport system substrate-binding protein
VRVIPILSGLGLPAVVTVLAVAGTACGGSDDRASGGGADRPTIAATTSVLASIVEAVAGDQADVEVIVPTGIDPHDFAPSTRQAEAAREADLIVLDGAGLEGGLTRVIDAAAEGGTPTFAFADHVELLGDDPHLWMDPARVAGAVPALGAAVGAIDGVDPAAVEQAAAAYAGELDRLDRSIADGFASLPPQRRLLVTNHEALGYFADRYGFTVVGAVVPSLATGAEPSASDLDELATAIERAGVPAIFAETTQPTRLADALADEVGDVAVVELFTESLGEPGSGADTYVGMLRTDARRIAEALA